MSQKRDMGRAVPQWIVLAHPRRKNKRRAEDGATRLLAGRSCGVVQCFGIMTLLTVSAARSWRAGAAETRGQLFWRRRNSLCRCSLRRAGFLWMTAVCFEYVDSDG